MDLFLSKLQWCLWYFVLYFVLCFNHIIYIFFIVIDVSFIFIYFQIINIYQKNINLDMINLKTIIEKLIET